VHRIDDQVNCTCFKHVILALRIWKICVGGYIFYMSGYIVEIYFQSAAEYVVEVAYIEFR
jgi:hypothetical protein